MEDLYKEEVYSDQGVFVFEALDQFWEYPQHWCVSSVVYT